jgi:hypothetical protein
MSKNERYLVSAYGMGENLAPLVHSEERLGNKVFFRRLSIKSGDDVVTAPVISGNSFRGAWRDLMALYLVDTLGIHSLSDLAFVTFFSGGTLTAGDSPLAQSLYNTFPSLRLFGFSMGGRMYPSRFGVDFAVPLTAETMTYARAAYPEQRESLPESTVEAGQITAMTMMTRKRDEEKAPLVDLTIEGEEVEEAGPTQMIFQVEYVVPNTTFVHGFRTVYPMSPLEFGALLKVLELSSQRSYGGQGSRGFGRMNWKYTLTWKTSLDDSPPHNGAVRLGQELHFDEPLKAFKKGYEDYVVTLPDLIQEDENLAPIIQLAAQGSSEGT